MKNEYENKHKGDSYTISNKVLQIMKVSLNTDEYSVERVYNFLNLSKALKNNKTKELWYDKFNYVLQRIKTSSPLKDHEKIILNEIFERILELKSDKKKFEDLGLLEPD